MRHPVTQDGANEKAELGRGAQLVERFAHHGATLGKHKLGKLYPPAAKDVDLGGGREAEHTVDLPRGGKLGVDRH